MKTFQIKEDPPRYYLAIPTSLEENEKGKTTLKNILINNFEQF